MAKRRDGRVRLAVLATIGLVGIALVVLSAWGNASLGARLERRSDDAIAAVRARVAGRDVPRVEAAGWAHYGGDAGGTRYSPLTEINRGNVGRLEVAWTYRTGDVSDGSETGRRSAFEATPILFEGRLYLPTVFSRVLALDPGTGRELWAHDPRLDLTVGYSEHLTARGVTAWRDEAAPADAPCAAAIYFATLDARLLALDAATGSPCPGFGDGGEVELKTEEVRLVEASQYLVTSPPVVVAGVVVVGSAIGDNRRVDVERGVVRGYDARTGERVWSWDPIPTGPEDPLWGEWTPDGARRTGAANAWAPLSADLDRGLVFVPTGSAAPDFYGGERPGANPYANSVVALEAVTGRPVWSFQVVHHDLWDYDVASQPTLADVGGRPAVVQATKMGHLFVLDRETGTPLFRVEERPVPTSDVLGEGAWPTQPFPVVPRPLQPSVLTADSAWGITPLDRRACRKAFASLRSEGIFTPPSLGGTLQHPSMIGGSNWGGVAVDTARRVVILNQTRVASRVRLVPRERWDAEIASPDRPSGDYTAQAGTPYGMNRDGVVRSPLGVPCSPPPWGTLTAVDLETGAVVWEVPLGTIRDIAPLPIPARLGTPNLGGPVATAGGLVFIGAAMDDYLRAFDTETGEELWKGRLPAGGQATPMTYRLPGGRQHVVIAAGGHGGAGTTLGDYVVAFALPE
jgi:quinoprotein glucose dehydrogenase